MDTVKNQVLVTGGAGFIGSHLVAGLVDRGYRVTVLDDLSTGKKENIERLVETGDVAFHTGSITDMDLLGKLLDGVKYCFHLAAMASVPQSIENPGKCHEINATGTLNVLTAARDAGVEKMVSISSCAVYGDTETVPVREDTLPNPRSPYAAAKLYGEHCCRLFTRLYDLPAVSLRFFNIFGPGQNPNSQYSAAIPLFIKRVLAGDILFIDGDGEQTRDFIFVEDAVAACIKAAESDMVGEYNVGSGVSTTINTLTRMIIDLTGKDTNVVYRDARPGDIRYSYADISRISGAGFHLGYGLEDGLKAMIDSMK